MGEGFLTRLLSGKVTLDRIMRGRVHRSLSSCSLRRGRLLFRGSPRTYPRPRLVPLLPPDRAAVAGCFSLALSPEPGPGGRPRGSLTAPPGAAHLGSCGGRRTAACPARTRTQTRLPCSRSGPRKRRLNTRRCLGREETAWRGPRCPWSGAGRKRPARTPCPPHQGERPGAGVTADDQGSPEGRGRGPGLLSDPRRLRTKRMARAEPFPARGGPTGQGAWAGGWQGPCNA